MSKTLVKVFLAILVLFVVCGVAFLATSEKGDISFVDPASNATFHEDNNGTLFVNVTLNSTFDDPKVATLSANGQFWTCTLSPNASTPCSMAPLTAPGAHEIRAEVFKRDGKTVVSAQTIVVWAPYTPLDKTMQGLSAVLGSDSPLPGYGLIVFIVAP